MATAVATRRANALPEKPARRAAGRRLIAAGLGLGLVLGTSACGFALRRQPRLSFDSIALQGFDALSPMALALRKQLQSQVKVVTDGSAAAVLLVALTDRRERSAVASTAAAQVRELQLRQRFSFRAASQSGRELIPRVELVLARDLSYIETAALAKEYEEAELYREMQDDIVNQVMRRLAALTL